MVIINSPVMVISFSPTKELINLLPVASRGLFVLVDWIAMRPALTGTRTMKLLPQRETQNMCCVRINAGRVYDIATNFSADLRFRVLEMAGLTCPAGTRFRIGSRI